METSRMHVIHTFQEWRELYKHAGFKLQEQGEILLVHDEDAGGWLVEVQGNPAVDTRPFGDAGRSNEEMWNTFHFAINMLRELKRAQERAATPAQ